MHSSIDYKPAIAAVVVANAGIILPAFCLKVKKLILINNINLNYHTLLLANPSTLVHSLGLYNLSLRAKNLYEN